MFLLLFLHSLCFYPSEQDKRSQNIYAPNIISEQKKFWLELSTVLNNFEGINDSVLVAGGDFNVTLNPELDRIGKDMNLQSFQGSRNELMSLLNQFDLCDIWRFHISQTKQYTWRRRDLATQSRLDYWFIPFNLQDYISSVDIIPSISTDHSAILLCLEIRNKKFGAGYWKFNSSLCFDKTFCASLRDSFKEWKEEANSFNAISSWDFLKFKIRRFSQRYSKSKAQRERKERNRLEKLIQEFELMGEDIDEEKKAKYEQTKQELEEYYNKVTDGLIIRSKANWVEYGEKSNKYFLTLEQQHKNKSNINKLLVEDKLINDDVEIREQIKIFYQNLYTKQAVQVNDENGLLFLNTEGIRLSEESMEICEGKLSKEECFKVLCEMPSGKSPGNDGLTKEFYMQFWDIISEPLLSSLNYSYDKQQLSNSQKQSVITLILKPNKDKKHLQNYRPISLLNVDAKICSKALAARIVRVLDEIIHPDQHAFLKGRKISEAIRNVHDMFHFLCTEQKDGFIISIDFQKAFDSIDHEYMCQALKSFGFGPSFINWVKTLYNDVEGCVLNNGISTGYFSIKRGVRQGDPLSPYLFLIALETLAIRIRNSKEILGIKIKEQEFKLSLYADDFCSFCPDIKSINKLFDILEQFHKCSSLKFNHEKTEILKIKPHIDVNNSSENVIDHKVTIVNNIKILGTSVGYNATNLQEENFNKLLAELKRSLNLWKARKLTLLGKIQILKTFGISKFTYLFSSITIPNRISAEIEKIFYDFLWNGPDRIKRNVMIQDLGKGGLNMIDVKSFIHAQQIVWIDKIKPGNTQIWYHVLKYYLNSYGGLVLFNCNYDMNDLSLNMPKFYLSVLENWLSIAMLTENQAFRNQIIWNNCEIKVDNKTVFYKRMFDKGICFLHQLVTTEGSCKSFQILKNEFDINNNDYFRIQGIHTATKKSVNLCIQNPGENVEQGVQGEIVIPECFRLISNLKSRHFYKTLIEMKYETPVSNFRLYSKYEMSDQEISSARKLIVQTSIDTKSREFQFKILNNILPLNYKLHKMKLVPSPYCSFGCTENETVEHILWTCPISQIFWNDIKRLLFVFDLSFINEKTMITGLIETCPNRMLINHILLIAKKSIYLSKCTNTHPCLSLFKTTIEKSYNEELFIARRKGKLNLHFKKWDELIVNRIILP